MELHKKDVRVELYIKVKEDDKETKTLIDVDMETAHIDNIPICGGIKGIKMNGDIRVKDAIYLEAIFRFLSVYFEDRLNRLNEEG